MPGSKLARLLQVVGGAPHESVVGSAVGKSKHVQQSNDSTFKHESGHLNDSATGRDPSQVKLPAASRSRKRRQTKAQYTVKQKRRRREAGPEAQISAKSAAAAVAQSLAEESKQLAAEREKLLGGRPAYEALMAELTRSGHHGAGHNGGSKAHLRAQLQLLRSEQMGESSNGDDEDGEVEEEDAVNGEDSGDMEDATATAAVNAKRRDAVALLSGSGDDGEEEQGSEDSSEEDQGEGETNDDHGNCSKGDATVNGRASGRKAKGGGDNISNDGGDGPTSNGLEDEGGGQRGVNEGQSRNHTQGGEGSEMAAVVDDTWVRHVGQELDDVEVAVLAAAEQCSFVDAPSADELHLTAWGPNAKWQMKVYGSAGSRGKAARTGSAGAGAASARTTVRPCPLFRTGLPPAPPTLLEYGVKERLVSRWRSVRQEDEARAQSVAAKDPVADLLPLPTSEGHIGRGKGSGGDGDFSNPQQMSLFSLLNSYADVHLTNRPYPTDASLDAPDPLLDAVLLHCLNHIAKTADRIKKNNHVMQQQRLLQEEQRLMQQQHAKQQHQKKRKPAKSVLKELSQEQKHESHDEQQHGQEDKQPRQGGRQRVEGDEEERLTSQQQQKEEVAVLAGTPRDQGFTRPKVLLLMPQRNLAFRAVRRLVALAIHETRSDSVQGKERFVEQFTDPDEVGEQAEEKLDAASRARLLAKPSEHRALFTGNLDDHFRLGIKVTKGAVRLFSDLYNSDVIVASPVALATKLAEDKAADPHSRPDFLSSIEILVLDRADVLGMQNWAHVETVVAALNQLPREQHGTDIMRVRDWYLSGLAAHYRQTVLMTSFVSADGNALVRALANHSGALRLAVEQSGVLGRVVPQVRQLFERFSAASPAAVGDARFEFFMRTVWPRLKESGFRGLLIFIPSYFDFVRLRNALQADDSVDLATISEYSAQADVVRSRARFFHSQRRLLLYTERAHFYHRYRIRGIKDVIFYGIPEHGEYYSELVNLLEEGGTGKGASAAAAAGAAHQATVTALFCRWDVLQLERVVGSGRARRMLTGENGTYMFC